jgi:PA domain-containing protein
MSSGAWTARATRPSECLPFDFASWEQNGPARLQRGERVYTEGTDETAGDYIVAQFSGSGTVTAEVATTNDISIPPAGGPGTGTSGCEAADWAGVDLTGKIALIQRGTCTFVEKVALAQSLGAAAVLIFNDGGPDREEPFQIGAEPFTAIPVAMTSAAGGAEIYTALLAGPVTMTFNVSITTRGGDPAQPDRGHRGGQSGADDRGRRPSRLGRRGPRHQRQRLGDRRADRDRRGDRRAASRSAQPHPVCVVGR